MEKMIQIAESYGWAVDMDSDSIEFNQCSPAGEDFSFTVLTKDASDAESLAAEVRSYADSFDTEEHVKMLVDAQGSVSGVPDIKTLVEDADAIQEMLNDLADALENGNADTDDEETEACGLEGLLPLDDAFLDVGNPYGRGRRVDPQLDRLLRFELSTMFWSMPTA